MLVVMIVFEKEVFEPAICCKGNRCDTEAREGPSKPVEPSERASITPSFPEFSVR